MLITTRSKGQRVTIGDSITIVILKGRCKLAIDAPPSYKIDAVSGRVAIGLGHRLAVAGLVLLGFIAGCFTSDAKESRVRTGRPPEVEQVVETMHEPGLLSPPSVDLVPVWSGPADQSPVSTDPDDYVPIPIPELIETEEEECEQDVEHRDQKGDDMELRVWMDDNGRQDGTGRTPDTSRGTADITLRTAFVTYLLPSIDGRRAKSTTSDYFNAISHWEAFVDERASTNSTRAPKTVYQISVVDSVYQISDHVLNEFGRWLVAEIPTSDSEGEPTRRMSIGTAGKQWKKIRAILRRCGPRGTGNPKGESLIEFVPAMDPLSELVEEPVEDSEPVDLTDGELGRLYTACDVAKWPSDEAALQWKTYIVICACLGPRVDDAARLTADDFSFDPASPLKRSTRESPNGWLVFTPDKTKRHKGRLIIPLPPCVATHVRELTRRRSGRLFAWSDSKGHAFRAQWQAIVDQAGMPELQRKHLRSTCTNRWDRVSGGQELGKWVLGHAARDVNERNYMMREHDLIEAAPKVQVPIEFTATLSGVATQPFLF